MPKIATYLATKIKLEDKNAIKKIKQVWLNKNQKVKKTIAIKSANKNNSNPKFYSANRAIITRYHNNKLNNMYIYNN